MRRYPLTLLPWLLVGVLVLFSQSWAVCPEAPNDNGECDSLNAGIHPSDRCIDLSIPSPFFVRISFYVTHDVPNPSIDSISAFILPMCYTHTNPSKYCSLTGYWNNITSFTNPRNIFRHLVIDGDTIHNWMMDQFEEGNGEEWSGIFLSLDGTSTIWFTLIPAGYEDQRFGEGSHVLLATMTFKLEDTTAICVDSCFWPPAIDYSFARMDVASYAPRDNMPYCVKVWDAIRGDANGDRVMDIADILYMLNYLFRFGPSPVCFASGDANCDNDHGILDVVSLVNYLYKRGPSPGCP